MTKLHGWIPRRARQQVIDHLALFPVVALVGARQVGKSSLAQALLPELDEDGVYLDLERPSHARRLDDPEMWFAAHGAALVCLDEVQRRPQLFEVLRSIVDERGRPGQLLILGSASPELLRQGSETLAGRIGFVELGGFDPTEVSDRERLWVRGGYPRAFLAPSEAASLSWRRAFVRTHLERDLASLDIRLPAEGLRRLWTMLAHQQGQELNQSRLGVALGLSHATIRRHLEALAGTFLVRLLEPWHGNTAKRLVKRPKCYVRDSGLLHALLGIDSFDALMGHPVFGHSWEGHVVESVLGVLPEGWRSSFYRTSHGAEIDLVLESGTRRVVIEAKAATAPALSRGFHNAWRDLDPERGYVVAPIDEGWRAGELLEVVSLGRICELARGGLPTCPP